MIAGAAILWTLLLPRGVIAFEFYCFLRGDNSILVIADIMEVLSFAMISVAHVSGHLNLHVSSDCSRFCNSLRSFNA